MRKVSFKQDGECRNCDGPERCNALQVPLVMPFGPRCCQKDFGDGRLALMPNAAADQAFAGKMPQDRGAGQCPLFFRRIQQQLKRCRQGAATHAQRFGIIAEHAIALPSGGAMPDSPLRDPAVETFSERGFQIASRASSEETQNSADLLFIFIPKALQAFVFHVKPQPLGT